MKIGNSFPLNSSANSLSRFGMVSRCCNMFRIGRYFLDSAKIDEIRYAYQNWGIDGVTTNPKHIAATGKPFQTVIKELADEFKGKEFPISIEIDPYLQKSEEMITQAKKIRCTFK